MLNSGQNCINKYDYTLRDPGPYDGCGMAWPPGVDQMPLYLSSLAVRTALHATKFEYQWQECSWDVRTSLIGDPSPPSITLFDELTKSIPITLYGYCDLISGTLDLLCNVLGIKNSLDALYWGNHQGFTNPAIQWAGTKQFGMLYTERNISFYEIYNASHMSPFDAPVACLDIFDRMIGIKDTPIPRTLTTMTTMTTVTKSISPDSATTKLMTPTISNHAEEQGSIPEIPSVSKSSHLGAFIFLLGFMVCVIFGGLYIRKRINVSKKREPWFLILI